MGVDQRVFRFIKTVSQLLAAVALAVTSLAAHSTLAGRDINGSPVAATAATAVFEYDTDLNITWLRDWNANGLMDWDTAMIWASTLTVGTYSGWRLPKRDPSCGSNYSCTGSEMGYLWYTELGNSASGPPTNTAPFINIQSNVYWTGTEYEPDLSEAWRFGILSGQFAWKKADPLYAVAVRPGDVGAVPEPGGLAMLLAALGALAVARRRRPH